MKYVLSLIAVCVFCILIPAYVFAEEATVEMQQTVPPEVNAVDPSNTATKVTLPRPRYPLFTDNKSDNEKCLIL